MGAVGSPKVRGYADQITGEWTPLLGRVLDLANLRLDRRQRLVVQGLTAPHFHMRPRIDRVILQVGGMVFDHMEPIESVGGKGPVVLAGASLTRWR